MDITVEEWERMVSQFNDQPDVPATQERIEEDMLLEEFIEYLNTLARD